MFWIYLLFILFILPSYLNLYLVSQQFSVYFLLKDLFYHLLIYPYVCLPAYMCAHRKHAWQRPDDCIQSNKTGFTDGCELPCGLCELASSPLQQYQVTLKAVFSLSPTSNISFTLSFSSFSLSSFSLLSRLSRIRVVIVVLVDTP